VEDLLVVRIFMCFHSAFLSSRSRFR